MGWPEPYRGFLPLAKQDWQILNRLKGKEKGEGRRRREEEKTKQNTLQVPLYFQPSCQNEFHILIWRKCLLSEIRKKGKGGWRGDNDEAMRTQLEASS